MNRKWNDNSEYLENFEPLRRSLIGNMFCNAIREGGCSTTMEVLHWVDNDAYKRWTAEFATGTPVEAAMETLRNTIGGEDAKKFADQILWRESLTFEEKDRLKKEVRSEAVQTIMQNQEPTDKQLAYLKSLRCPTIPKTKLEASELISKLVKAK